MAIDRPDEKKTKRRSNPATSKALREAETKIATLQDNLDKSDKAKKRALKKNRDLKAEASARPRSSWARRLGRSFGNAASAMTAGSLAEVVKNTGGILEPLDTDLKAAAAVGAVGAGVTLLASFFVEADDVVDSVATGFLAPAHTYAARELTRRAMA